MIDVRPFPTTQDLLCLWFYINNFVVHVRPNYYTITVLSKVGN